VQLRLPWDRPVRELPGSGHQVSIDGQLLAVEIARHRRARRYVLRMRDDGRLRLTVPRGASIDGGLRFAERQHDWIRRERARQVERARGWDSGTTLWFRGERVTLTQSGAIISCGDQQIPVGKSHDLRATIETHLRGLATRELTARCRELASLTGIPITRVSVRNQRSRWGACSARGLITLNWRLIQMPASVSDYVILHELSHVKHPNHSRRFWRAVESICAYWRDAERWLRRHGREIL